MQSDAARRSPAPEFHPADTALCLRARHTLVLALSVLLILAVACTTTREVSIELDTDGELFGLRSAGLASTDPEHSDLSAGAGAQDSTSDLASLIRPLPPLQTELPSERSGPRPVSIVASSIEVDDGEVVPVGVDDQGNFDVPGRSEVGWYSFGPSPGEVGSSVLAAHITLDGGDGVFRRLADLSFGDIVTVGYDDGSSIDFEIQGLAQYDKAVVPLDRIFDRTGPARLVLISCGGGFNPQINSFDDNIIAFGIPVATVSPAPIGAS